MKKDVLIRIHGCQYVEGEKDVTDIATVGSLERDDSGYTLCYQESEPSGMEGSEMTVRVESDKKVTLTRRGSFNSQMILEKGTRNICHYNTPYGGVVFGIFAETVHTDVTDNGGEVRLNYTIDVNNDLASKNEINIKIREAGISNVSGN